MKTKYIFLYIVLLSHITLFAQKEQRAKEILDITSSTLSEDSGIKATFLLKNFHRNKLSGETKGSISLKGNRFILETPGTTTWFNGQTQWTYIVENEEINISTPTEEELQSINPYSFINLYKKGFTYKLNGTILYKGKNVYKLMLMPKNKKQDISLIELFVEQNSYQPVFIRVHSQQGDEMQVDILSYRNKENLSDSSFTLDPKRYPHTEIIDLR